MIGTRKGIGLACLAAALATSAIAEAGQKAKVALAATSDTPTARGSAVLQVKSATQGKFTVKAQRLDRDAEFDVIVGGIKVATLRTTGGGGGKVKFSSTPRGKDLFLGFDPRGEAIELRRTSGINVLTGNLPDGTSSHDGDGVCCVPDGGGDGPAECEDRTAAECAAEGGTLMTATSCLPNPCADAPPPVDTDVVCCIPDDSGPECEDRTTAECAAAGGTVVEATSCADNPCAGTPTSPDEDVQCCIAGYYVYECEDRTAGECAAIGGINQGPGVCTPNPCGNLPPPNTHGACCLPNAAGDEIECEDRSPSACEAAGGTPKGSGVCAVDTCADVPPPNPDVMCCLPKPSGELECEDRTATQCGAEGGTSLGAGVCPLDTNPCDTGSGGGGGGGGGGSGRG